MASELKILACWSFHCSWFSI